MTWVILAAGAQLINAFVAIGDKYLVTDVKTNAEAFCVRVFTHVWLQLSGYSSTSWDLSQHWLIMEYHSLEI